MSTKILIIDDDQLLSKSTASRLNKRGFETTIIHSGKQGATAAIEQDFDLILLDIKMPDLSGDDVLIEIRKHKAKNILPIIMLTSCEEQDDIINSFSIGANDYILKPINIEILLARINTQVDLRMLSLKFAKDNEIKTLNAMVITYNHEINNPLTIAFFILNKIKSQKLLPEDYFKKLEISLNRIRDIVKQIDQFSKKKTISFTEYTDDSEMIDLKK